MGACIHNYTTRVNAMEPCTHTCSSPQKTLRRKFVHHKLMGRLSEAMLVLLAALYMMLPLTRAVTCKKVKQQLPNRTVSPDRKYNDIVVHYGIEECPQEKHA